MVKIWTILQALEEARPLPNVTKYHCYCNTVTIKIVKISIKHSGKPSYAYRSAQQKKLYPVCIYPG